MSTLHKKSRHESHDQETISDALDIGSCDETLIKRRRRPVNQDQPRPLRSEGIIHGEPNHQSGDDDHGAAATSHEASSADASTAVLVENLRTTNVNGAVAVETGRERLKRHRIEVAGRVWIPEIWGQEELLKDWIDCSAFDASIMNTSIMSARAALVEEGRRASSSTLRIENSC